MAGGVSWITVGATGYYLLMAAGLVVMLVSLGCLILGRKRSDNFFLFWIVLFTLAFFLELLIFRGKISIC